MYFRVRGITRQASIVEVLLDAPSRTAALADAEHQGLRVLAVRRQVRGGRGGGRAQDIEIFSRELATLLGAGLPLVEAVRGLADKEENAATHKVFVDVAGRLAEGMSFSQAVGRHPSVFPELYVALMRSAERTGELADALRRFVAYSGQTELVRKKLIAASIYPSLLLCAGSAVLLFLVAYVVPKFSYVYEDMGDELPWLSALLINGGRAVHAHQPWLFAGLAGLALAAFLAWRHAGLRLQLVRAIEALPGLRRRLLVYRLARLYRSLGILLRGGIPILPAIAMVRGLLPPELRQRLDAAGARIREGVSASEALERYGLTTSIALRMLRAGEKSGNVGEMMEQSADFHDEEVARWIDWFVRLVEPLMMTLIGAVIGIIVVLMYIPIFELAGSIQ